MKNKFYLIPVIGSAIFSFFILIFLFAQYDSISNFFLQNANTDGNLMIQIAMLLTAVIISLLASIISVVLIWLNAYKK